MHKAAKMLLGTVFALAVAGGNEARAAAIGLEWGWVPTIPFGDFDIRLSNQEFTLSWKVSDDFTVGVFRGDGQYRGEREYTNNTVSPTIGHKLAVTGTTSVSGIRILVSIPALSMLSAGLEVGAMTLGAGSYTYTNSDGTGFSTASPDARFGAGQAFGGATAALLGAVGKASLIRAESKTVTTEITVNAALRFVDLSDTLVFGSQESNKTTPTDIDAVTNYTNLAITVAVGLWF